MSQAPEGKLQADTTGFYRALAQAAREALDDSEDMSPIMGINKKQANEHIGQIFPPDANGDPLEIDMREGIAYRYDEDRGMLRFILTNGHEMRFVFALFGEEIHFEAPVVE